MIFFRILLLFLSIFSILSADVRLIAPDSFVKGEPYSFQLEASGSSLKFPKIESIDGYMVEDQGTSKSMQYINGDYSEKFTKRYKIVPQKSFTIPSFKFTIDGKEVLTKEKKVVEKSVNKTVSNNFDLTISSSKKSPYVGEDIDLKLVFKYKKGLQITNLGFETPHFDNFWYKKIDNSSKSYEENGYVVQELDFLLFPQKSGKLEISPLKIDVQMVDRNSNASNPFSFFSAAPIDKKIYSNRLTFDVKSLPKGVNLIGDFDIHASVDKQSIKEGESLSLILNIDGNGNFDDIGDIKLNIPDATIYDNKPKIETNYTDKGYVGKYSKVFSIIPNNSLTIPSIELKYFDKESQKIVVKHTKPFKIEVQKVKKEKAVLQKAKEIESTSVNSKNQTVISDITTKEKIKYFIFGIIVSLLVFVLFSLVKGQGKEKKALDTPLITLVKKAKTKDEMIKILLPYIKKDGRLDDLIFRCEGNEEFKPLKKEIISLIKELKF